MHIKYQAFAAQIIKIRNRLAGQRAELVRQIRSLPEGDLRLMKNSNRLSCYCSYGKHRKSIPANSILAGKLARKYYLGLDIKILDLLLSSIKTGPILKIADKRLGPSQFIKSASGIKRFERISSIFSDANFGMTPDEERWSKANYRRCKYKPEELKYETPNGVKVRTKSEYIIACFLEKLCISYRYEPEIWTGGKTYYPDFEIYIAPGVTVFWEHLGLAGEGDYDSHNIRKLHDYNLAGISTNKNLIITFEKDIESEESLTEIIYHAFSL